MFLSNGALVFFILLKNSVASTVSVDTMMVMMAQCFKSDIHGLNHTVK